MVLGIAAALAALLFLTQSLYALALPFSVLCVWLGASPSRRFRDSLWWLISLGAAQALVLFGYLPIIARHAGTLSDLAYLPRPTVNDLFGQFFFDSALGLAALMVLTTSVVFRRSKALLSERCSRNLLIGNAVAAVLPIAALWLASNHFGVTLFTPRYFMLTAPFSALAAAALLESTALWRLNLVGAVVLGAVGLGDTGARLVREASFQDQLARDISSIDVRGCPLFASTGYIDLQIPGRIEDRRMYSFLSAPVTYYKKVDVHLMPNSLDHEPARRYFEEKVLPKLLTSPCLTAVAYNLGFSTAERVFTPYASELRERLQAAGFSVTVQSRVSDQPNAFMVMRAQKNLSPGDLLNGF
jgi:hypothetical protein